MYKLNQEKLLSELNRKWVNKSCCMCGQSKWNIDAQMVTPMKFNENGGIQLGGNLIPLVPVTCTYCGNVLFVNPMVLDAVDVINDGENK